MTNSIRVAISRIGWSAALIYVALHTAGCGSGQPGTDLRFSYDQRVDDALMSAGDVWCAATSGSCCPTMLTEGSVHVEAIQSRYVPCRASAIADGCTSVQGSKATIRISSLTDGPTMFLVTLHELGHLCRASVLSGPQGHIAHGNIMSAGADAPASYPTDADVAFAEGR